MSLWNTSRMMEITAWALTGPLRSLKITPRYYYVGLALLIVVMVIALVKAYRVWEEIQDVEDPDSPADLLQSFEEARAAGELNDEEMERVRQQLALSGMPLPKKPAASAPASDDGNPESP